MLLSLKHEIIYGPVRSRRLGRSLGINVFPGGRKVCTFDCRYCQYGFATPSSPARLDPGRLASTAEILDAVRDALSALAAPPDYLTFSGNGEATLHPDFGDLVDGVTALRNRIAPTARTAILSNASRVGVERMRAAIERLDVRIMKLDVGTEAALRSFNRPSAGITLAAIVDGLRALPNVTIQTLFADGPTGNLGPADVDAWIEQVAIIRPDHVQLYTLDRDAPCEQLVKTTRDRLEKISDRLASRGVAATVAWRGNDAASAPDQ